MAVIHSFYMVLTTRGGLAISVHRFFRGSPCLHWKWCLPAKTSLKSYCRKHSCDTKAMKSTNTWVNTRCPFPALGVFAIYSFPFGPSWRVQRHHLLSYRSCGEKPTTKGLCCQSAMVRGLLAPARLSLSAKHPDHSWWYGHWSCME